MEERVIEAMASAIPEIEGYDGDNLIEDLGIDSHDIFNIIVALEDEFDIEIPPTNLKVARFSSVENIVELVKDCLNK